MEFWASSEAFRLAGPASEEIRKCVEPRLNAAFTDSALSDLNRELRYVPIIVPEGLRERYSARSELREKERIYVCAPQLDYAVFVSGSFDDQLREYVRGIAGSAPYLAGLGATPEQIKEFEEIIATVVERILAERPKQTEH